MPADAVVQNLLVLYAGATLINVVFAAALWWSTRDPTVRSLFLGWTSVMFALLSQGLLVEGDLAVTLGFSLVFLNNLSFAHVLAGIAGVSTPWRPLLALFAAGIAGSAAAAALDLGFTAVALPTSIAVAAPAVAVGARVIARRWRALTAQGRALTLSCLVFSAHNLDFAFLRDDPALAPAGFTVAVLVVFALSVSAPAALLEQVTQRQARLAGQLDVARTLQRRLVPADARLDGLDVAAHMRSAESVGGDYLQVFRGAGTDWFFVGDVAGHGFGAGLLTLMAHSTVASIIEARPGASPREVNDLANRVLCRSLEQLAERRYMTVVSMRRDGPDGRLVVSGSSHEDLLVYRAREGHVESVALAHLPLGLGYRPVPVERIGEVSLELSAGDLVFVGTDGVFEAARDGDPHLDLFGQGRVRELLVSSAGAPLDEIKRRLLERLDAFTGGRYEDDVAFLMLRARGEEAA